MRATGARWGALLCVLCVVALFSACGTRSRLRGAQPCRTEGEIQACVGICGEGTVECVDGFWTECAIPPVEVSCENTCGEGLQRCENEVWGECLVEPTEGPCENDCGQGTRLCVDDEWGECQVEPVTIECDLGCGPGLQSCVDNTWGECDAPKPLPPTLQATIRDFSSSHPDMERPLSMGTGREMGIVEDVLGADGKPVYAAGPGGTATTTGPAEFDQWYRDVPGINQSTEITISLQASSRDEEFYVYEDRQFFPIDGQLFGNEGNAHNYHFTLEAEASFVYREGQVFAFDGDDDIWVFINDRLVIDLGGLHESLREDVALDDVADEIGIIPGEEYPLKIFFAERHTVDSNFVIETSIANLGECPDQLPN